MVAHHDCVFQQKEVWRATKLFNLGQGPGRGRLGSDGNEFGELKVVFGDVVDVLAVVARLPTQSENQS